MKINNNKITWSSCCPKTGDNKVGLSDEKKTFSLLSVFTNNLRNFVCSWSPAPLLLGGPDIARLCGNEHISRGLFGGNAGGSVRCGLNITSIKIIPLVNLYIVYY